MEQIAFEAHRRAPGAKGAARKLRAEGLVPGVVYGHGLEPIPLTVPARIVTELLRHHRGGNALFDLKVDGESPEGLAAIVKTLQADPVSDELLSVDFQWVSLTEHVHVHVPIRAEGVAAGVKTGGMLGVILHELTISCLPTDIPEVVVVDVTELELGQALHVYDVVPPPGCTILTPGDETVLNVRAPAVVLAAVAAEEEVEEEAEAEAEAEE